MKTNTTVQTYEVLNSMTRDEVRALATHLNVPRGKDKKNTVANLSRALADGKARIKSIVTISTNPPDGSQYGGKVLFVKKFRSYKPDRVLNPVPPVVVPDTKD
jgi:hypothetical protein